MLITRTPRLIEAIAAGMFLVAAATSACRAQGPIFELQVRPILPVKVGDSIAVEVLVVNNSDKAQATLVPLAWPNSQLSLILIGPDGPVEVSTEYEHFTLEHLEKDYSTVIPPRAFVGRRVTIWPSGARPGAAQLLPPGRYRLSGGMHIFPVGKNGMAISSDTTSFTIAPTR